MREKNTAISHRCVLCGASCGGYIDPEAADSSNIYAFNYVECPACDIAFLSPVPGEEQLAAHYKATPRAAGHDNPENYKMSASRIRAVAAAGVSKSGSRILDYGCGKGETVYCLMKDGWDVTGVEPFFSPAYDIPELNRRIISASLSETGFPDAHFDMVMMWSVLEHITDPAALLGEISRILKKGGKLLIYVPSYNTGQHRKFGKYWPGFGAPEHITVLSGKGLSRFMAPLGFTLRKTLNDSRTSRWMYKTSAARAAAEKKPSLHRRKNFFGKAVKIYSGISAFAATGFESLAGRCAYSSFIFEKSE